MLQAVLTSSLGHNKNLRPGIHFNIAMCIQPSAGKKLQKNSCASSNLRRGRSLEIAPHGFGMELCNFMELSISSSICVNFIFSFIFHFPFSFFISISFFSFIFATDGSRAFTCFLNTQMMEPQKVEEALRVSFIPSTTICGKNK